MASTDSSNDLTPPQTPPRTGSSSASDHAEPKGLGLSESTPPIITTHHDYDIAQGMSDSPSRPLESGRTDSTFGSMLSPNSATFSSMNTGGLSPAAGSLYTPYTPPNASRSSDHGDSPLLLADRTNNDTTSTRNPFNFTPMQYTANQGMARGRSEAVGKRKGHKYRHSSVHASAMDSIIQPPSLRTPLAVPASLPIPTRKEAWRSLTPNQSSRLAWCLCHFLAAGYVQFIGAGSLAITALSRLLLFDAAGATACVAVDVMGNFEVWKRSSIKHPFGLERADVLAGFGMAVFIAFMGLDVISHGIEHSLENVGAHEPHTAHDHGRVTGPTIRFASFLAIAATLVSAVLLRNHRRIGKATRFATLTETAWGSLLFGNPSHVLTFSCSFLLLILPLLPEESYAICDFALSVLIAVLMIAFGVRLGTSLASMLLMSYKPGSHDQRAVREVVADIAGDPGVSAVDEARFWQVHYGLSMANLKLKCRSGLLDGDGGGEMVRVRQRIASLIRQRLGGKWEVSTQMAVDRDR